MENALTDDELKSIVKFVEVTKDKKPVELREVAKLLHIDLEPIIEIIQRMRDNGDN